MYYQKLVVLVLSMVMIVACAEPTFANNAVTQPVRYMGEGFSVDFILNASWADGYSAELRISNNTDQDIEKYNG